MLTQAVGEMGLSILAIMAGIETPRLVNVFHGELLHATFDVVPPVEFSLEETVCVIRLAERVKKIRTMARKNVVRGTSLTPRPRYCLPLMTLWMKPRNFPSRTVTWMRLRNYLQLMMTRRNSLLLMMTRMQPRSYLHHILNQILTDFSFRMIRFTRRCLPLSPWLGKLFETVCWTCWPKVLCLWRRWCQTRRWQIRCLELCPGIFLWKSGSSVGLVPR